MFPGAFLLINSTDWNISIANDKILLLIAEHLNLITITGWPHFSQDKIPCVFPEFSLCYIIFPCVIFKS